jgi:lysozyme family protein
MLVNFQKALNFTLEYEGGWSLNPHDPGGATMRGITRVTLSHELGRMATLTELRNISPELVASIYRKKYWNLIGANDLPPGVDLMLFDIAVNMGGGRAEQWDEATHNLQPKVRITRLNELRMGFWRRLATWAYFGRGWTRREVACKALALNMIGG